MRSGNIFLSGKRGPNIESVSVLSIFLPENTLISKKKVFTLNLYLISRISDLQGEPHGTMAPPSKYVTESYNSIQSFCSIENNVFKKSLFFVAGSYLKGNISEIKLLKEPVFGQLRYTCVVSNNLGVSVNATFLQVPSASGKYPE